MTTGPTNSFINDATANLGSPNGGIVASLQGLTGNITFTSSNDTIGFTAIGNTIDLTVGGSKTVIIEGDSISAGFGATHPFSYYMTPLSFVNNGSIFNVAVNDAWIAPGSNSGNNISDRYAANVYPRRPAANGGTGGTKSYLILMIGTNPLAGGNTAATVITNLATYTTQARADGFTVVLGLITPRVTGGWTIAVDGYRADVNQAIGQQVIPSDIQWDACQIAGNALNTEYYPDGLHWSTALQKQVGVYLNGVLNSAGTYIQQNRSQFDRPIVSNLGGTVGSYIAASTGNPIWTFDCYAGTYPVIQYKNGGVSKYISYIDPGSNSFLLLSQFGGGGGGLILTNNARMIIGGGTTDDGVSGVICNGGRGRFYQGFKDGTLTSTMIKADASGNYIAAVAGTDYATPTNFVTTATTSGLTAVFTVDFTTYSKYVLQFNSVSLSGADGLTFEASSNAGSSYATTTYEVKRITGIIPSDQTTNIAAALSGAGLIVGTIEFWQDATNGTLKFSTMNATTGDDLVQFGAGTCAVSAAVNTIKLATVGGVVTYDAGSISIYPVARR